MLPSLLNSYKILEFEGVRGCGKTYACLSVAQSITHADEKTIVLPLIQSDPRLAISGARPHVVDEWEGKRMPELQELAYREAEATGSLLLTTSVRPDAPEPYVRTHAGRGAHVHMHTLSLFELGLSNGSVSLAGLLDGRFEPASRHVSVGTIASYLCRGGWPFTRKAESTDALEPSPAAMSVASLPPTLWRWAKRRPRPGTSWPPPRDARATSPTPTWPRPWRHTVQRRHRETPLRPTWAFLSACISSSALTAGRPRSARPRASRSSPATCPATQASASLPAG